MSEQGTILDTVLAAWADGIREHRPEQVASLFTDDAVFQGFDRTHTVGRPGIAAYYDKQPVGLDPHYRSQESRSLGDDAFIAFVDVDFVRPPGDIIPTHLTLALVRTGGEWHIQHYHVSKIDA